MAQYTNVGGVARRVTKRYENVGGVARSIVAAYTNVSGAARQFFRLGGVKWRKWSCQVTTEHSYTRTDYGVGETQSFTVGESSVWWTTWGSYTFSGSSGFEGDYGDYGKADPDTIVGRYSLADTEVREWISCTDLGNGKWELVWEVVGTAEEYSWYDYTKGTTDYGVVYAEEGALPADGTLEEGSATGSYCILLTGGTYYYYEKVT